MIHAYTVNLLKHIYIYIHACMHIHIRPTVWTIFKKKWPHSWFFCFFQFSKRKTGILKKVCMHVLYNSSMIRRLIHVYRLRIQRMYVCLYVHIGQGAAKPDIHTHIHAWRCTLHAFYIHIFACMDVCTMVLRYVCTYRSNELRSLTGTMHTWTYLHVYIYI